MILRRNREMAKVITGRRTRLSYANVWSPKAGPNGGKEAYSCVLLIPKDDKKTVEAIRNAIKEAYEEGKSKLKGSGKTVPPLASIRTPLRDGDAERPEQPEFADHYFVSAKSYVAPGIVDLDRKEILDHSEVYSGVYARASVNFYAYNTNGNKGIACGLNHLQKIRDGEPFGGRGRAEDDFANLDDEDEEDDLLG